MHLKEGAILNQSYEFAISIVNLHKYLVSKENEFVMSRQLLPSGTAVGALVCEAQNAESHADFIHKLGIAQKECAESQYWLKLLMATSYINKLEFDILFDSATGILKMIRSAIITSKKKTNK